MNGDIYMKNYKLLLLLLAMVLTTTIGFITAFAEELIEPITKATISESSDYCILQEKAIVWVEGENFTAQNNAGYSNITESERYFASGGKTTAKFEAPKQ